MEIKHVKGKINECCNVEENLILQPTENPDATVKICQICNKRHFRLCVDPAKIGGK